MWIYVVAGIVLLLVLLFLSPIVLTVKFEETLQVKLRFLFVSLWVYPKEKKAKSSPKKSKSKTKQQPSSSKQGTVEKVRGIFSVLSTLLSSSLRLVDGARVRNLKLTLGITGKDAADAAISYGQVCSVVYPVLGYVDSKMNLINPQVNIYCDYTAEESVIQGSAVVCVSAYHAVGTALYILKALVKKNLKNKGGYHYE